MNRCEQQRKYRRRQRRLHTLRVPPQRAAERLEELNAAGLGLRAISSLTGLHRKTLTEIRQGKRQWIAPETEQALFACEVVPHDYMRVPARITQRMIHSLMAMGWTTGQLDRETGKRREVQNILQKRPDQFVWYRTQEEYLRWFEKLAGGPPEPHTREEKQTRARVLNDAKRNGWAPPLAWDDVTDPLERPKGVLPR